MNKFFIKTGSFVVHNMIQYELNNIGYKWFLNDNLIDIGSCGYILIIGDKYITLSMDNYDLQPHVIDDFVELKSFNLLPVLNNS